MEGSIMAFQAQGVRWRAVLVAVLALLAGACAPLDDRPAPVDDRSIGRAGGVSSAPASAVRQYQVRRGDTLYAIAFRNGLDYRDLARWNSIADPFVIYPGQQLRLGPPGDHDSAATRPTVTASAEPGRIQAIEEPAPARMEPLPERPIPPQNRDAVNPTVAGTRPANAGAGSPASAERAATTSSSTASSTPAVGSAASGSVGTGQASAAVSPVAATPAAAPGVPAAAPSTPTIVSGGAERTAEGVRWRWPADGRVINGFLANEPTRQGIDIMGTEGQPVLAAAAGEVVYSGSGLIGYGELIIIKHTDSLLSAYGHNRRRMVNEGARVSAGQVIAEMGRSGGSVPMLHFEIRRNGRPVDPRGFLPPR